MPKIKEIQIHPLRKCPICKKTKFKKVDKKGNVTVEEALFRCTVKVHLKRLNKLQPKDKQFTHWLYECHCCGGHFHFTPAPMVGM